MIVGRPNFKRRGEFANRARSAEKRIASLLPVVEEAARCAKRAGDLQAAKEYLAVATRGAFDAMGLRRAISSSMFKLRELYRGSNDGDSDLDGVDDRVGPQIEAIVAAKERAKAAVQGWRRQEDGL